jgi:hypothetical protein
MRNCVSQTKRNFRMGVFEDRVQLIAHKILVGKLEGNRPL